MEKNLVCKEEGNHQFLDKHCGKMLCCIGKIMALLNDDICIRKIRILLSQVDQKFNNLSINTQLLYLKDSENDCFFYYTDAQVRKIDLEELHGTWKGTLCQSGVKHRCDR